MGHDRADKKQIKAFHDEIVNGYTEIFSGNKDVVGHMKEILKEAFTTYLGYEWVDID